MKGKKLLGALLAVALVFGLFAVMPLTASAASDTWNATAPNIGGWSGTGNTITIEANATGTLSVPNDTEVTIVSSGAVINNNAITIALGNAGSKVIWEANYSGTVAGDLISITNSSGSGNAVFDVAAGSITQESDNNAITASGYTTVKVSGGTVKSAGTGATLGAINTTGTVIISAGLVENTNSGFAVYGNNVTVSDGTVKAGAGWGLFINSSGATIMVSGGTVEATTGLAINAYTAGTVVTVSGGTVKATGVGGVAIEAGGTVNISQAAGSTTLVSATTGKAIYVSTGTVNLSGGTVSATGAGGVAIEAAEIEKIGAGTATVSSTGTAITSSVAGGEIHATAGTLNITGAVSLTGASSVYADGGTLNITGNVSATVDVWASNYGVMTVTGNVTAKFIGSGTPNGGTLTVNGNVTVNAGGDIEANNGGKTYITGTVANGTKIEIGSTTFTLGTTSPTTPNGLSYNGYYWDVYTDPAVITPSSYVYIRQGVATVPTITTASLPGGTVGTAYSQTLAATGDATITWTLDSGSLPGGLSLSAAGVISGTPTAAGAFNFTVKATNGAGNATKALALTVTGGGTPPSGGGSGSSYTNASITPTKADFDKNGGKDISITLSKGSYTLQSLKNGSYTLKSGTDFTVSGNTYTIKAAYLNTLVVGEQSITFGMSGGTSPKLTVTVKDTAKPAVWANPFTDVKEGAWYYDAVKYVYEKGLIIGTAADKFSPDSTLTRGMIVTILYRHAGEPDISGLSNPFDDVAADIWYTNAVKWAANNGIVAGYGNGKYGPNDPITKEQLAVIIHRTQQATGKTPKNVGGASIPDAGKVSSWAIDAVNALNNQGIFKDIPGDSFNPQTPASRAEVASMLFRYLTAVE